MKQKSTATQRSRSVAVDFQFRPRLHRGRDIAFGPGKADLLENIDRTQSIGRAAATLKMSYMRAWSLIQVMNRCFERPLVETRRGGSDHGNAGLTPAGKKVLALYRRIQARCRQATRADQKSLQKLLRP